MAIKKSFVKLLGIVALLTWARISESTPLERLFGNGTIAYHQTINNRFIQFYKSQIYDFEKNFSQEERLYYDFCLKNIDKWSLDLENDFPLGYLRFAITLENDQVRFDRFAIAPSKNKAEAWPLIQKILHQKKLTWPDAITPQNVFWLEWDWSLKTFSIYYFDKGDLAQALYNFSENAPELPKKILGRSRQVSKIVRYKIIQDLGPIKRASILDPYILSGLSSDQGFTWLDLKGFDTRIVNGKVRESLNRIGRETAFTVDTIQHEGFNKAVFFYP